MILSCFGASGCGCGSGIDTEAAGDGSSVTDSQAALVTEALLRGTLSDLNRAGNSVGIASITVTRSESCSAATQPDGSSEYSGFEAEDMTMDGEAWKDCALSGDQQACRVGNGSLTVALSDDSCPAVANIEVATDCQTATASGCISLCGASFDVNVSITTDSAEDCFLNRFSGPCTEDSSEFSGSILVDALSPEFEFSEAELACVKEYLTDQETDPACIIETTTAGAAETCDVAFQPGGKYCGENVTVDTVEGCHSLSEEECNGYRVGYCGGTNYCSQVQLDTLEYGVDYNFHNCHWNDGACRSMGTSMEDLECLLR